jgi:hypothetical protein
MYLAYAWTQRHPLQGICLVSQDMHVAIVLETMEPQAKMLKP